VICQKPSSLGGKKPPKVLTMQHSSSSATAAAVWLCRAGAGFASKAAPVSKATQPKASHHSYLGKSRARCAWAAHNIPKLPPGEVTFAKSAFFCLSFFFFFFLPKTKSSQLSDALRFSASIHFYLTAFLKACSLPELGQHPLVSIAAVLSIQITLLQGPSCFTAVGSPSLHLCF